MQKVLWLSVRSNITVRKSKDELGVTDLISPVLWTTVAPIIGPRVTKIVVRHFDQYDEGITQFFNEKLNFYPIFRRLTKYDFCTD